MYRGQNSVQWLRCGDGLQKLSVASVAACSCAFRGIIDLMELQLRLDLEFKSLPVLRLSRRPSVGGHKIFVDCCESPPPSCLRRSALSASGAQFIRLLVGTRSGGLEVG